MANTEILTGVLEEIAGSTEYISGGQQMTASLTSAPYIRINGKRIMKVQFDNYIGTALLAAFSTKEEVSIAIYKGLIVAVKRANGEVSRGLGSTFTFVCASTTNLIIGIVVAFLATTLIGGNLENFELGATAGVVVFTGFCFGTLRKIFQYRKMRNYFGAEA